MNAEIVGRLNESFDNRLGADTVLAELTRQGAELAEQIDRLKRALPTFDELRILRSGTRGSTEGKAGQKSLE
jgi:hypothetical protein